jgi:hypothetical protein
MEASGQSHILADLSVWEELRLPLVRRLLDPRTGMDAAEERKISLALLGIKPRLSSP